MLPELNLSWHLEQLLSGKVTPQEADPRILTWAELYVHKGAVEVLGIADKTARRAALGKIPATIRPYVEREALRLWNERRANKG